MMEINWHSKTINEFLDLNQETQKEIKEKIEKLPEKGLDWEKIELIDRPEIDFTCYKLKIDPEDKEEINQRALFKVEEDEYLVLKIGRRPNFYDLNNLEEAQKRLS